MMEMSHLRMDLKRVAENKAVCGKTAPLRFIPGDAEFMVPGRMGILRKKMREHFPVIE